MLIGAARKHTAKKQAPNDSPVHPSQWPAKWVREESFWREMTTRTASGLLVASVIAALALSTGMGGYPPAVKYTVAEIVISATMLVVYGVIIIGGYLGAISIERFWTGMIYGAFVAVATISILVFIGYYLDPGISEKLLQWSGQPTKIPSQEIVDFQHHVRDLIVRLPFPDPPELPY